MRIPFFLMRFAMFAAVLAVVGLIVWLLVQEDKRDVVDQPETDKSSANVSHTDSIDQNSANINELLIRLNQVTPPPKNSPYIVQATRIQERIDILQSLMTRIDELNEATSAIVKRGLLATLYQLHSINRFEQVADANLYEDLQTCVNQLANDDDAELRMAANFTRTAISVLDVFDRDRAEGELEAAQKAIDQLFADYPNEPFNFTSLYALISDYGSAQNAHDNTITLLKHVNQHSTKSTNADVLRLGRTFSGRVLLIENKVISLKGQLALNVGSDDEAIVNNLKNFFAIELPLSVQIAEAIGDIANGLESMQKNKSALKIYRLLDERVRSEKNLEPVALTTDEGLRRLESAGKPADFPDVVEGQPNLVLFVSNSIESKLKIRELADLRILSPRTKLKLILVTFEEDSAPLQQFIDEYRLDDLTLITDPQKTSSYYRSYPAVFFPSVMLVDANGIILDSNMTRKRTKELLEEISESS